MTIVVAASTPVAKPSGLLNIQTKLGINLVLLMHWQVSPSLVLGACSCTFTDFSGALGQLLLCILV